MGPSLLGDGGQRDVTVMSLVNLIMISISNVIFIKSLTYLGGGEGTVIMTPRATALPCLRPEFGRTDSEPR